MNEGADVRSEHADPSRSLRMARSSMVSWCDEDIDGHERVHARPPIHFKAGARKIGREGPAKTATDDHVRGDPTKKALDLRDVGVNFVVTAQDLNLLTMYIDEVHRVQSDRPDGDLNP